VVAGAIVVLTELLVLVLLAVEVLEWRLAISEAIAAAFIWLGVADEGEGEEDGEDGGEEEGEEEDSEKDEVTDAEDGESAIGTNSISSEPLTGCEVVVA
jgi:hypothetical protein